MDEQTQTTYENVDPIIDDFYEEQAEASSINPKILGGGAAILGIAAGLAWKKREVIKAKLDLYKEERRMKKVAKLMRKVSKLSGDKPENVEETEKE